MQLWKIVIMVNNMLFGAFKRDPTSSLMSIKFLYIFSFSESASCSKTLNGLASARVVNASQIYITGILSRTRNSHQKSHGLFVFSNDVSLYRNVCFSLQTFHPVDTARNEIIFSGFLEVVKVQVQLLLSSRLSFVRKNRPRFQGVPTHRSQSIKSSAAIILVQHLQYLHS